MKQFRYWVIQLMGLSKAEANGAILLFTLIIIIIATPFAFKATMSNSYDSYSKDSAMLNAILDSIKIQNLVPPSQYNSFNNKEAIVKVDLKEFNPNKVSYEELTSLGFTKNQSNQIVNYVNKGGRFNIKTDLLKIYSMDTPLFKRVEPYILLPNKTVLTKLDSGTFNFNNEKDKSSFEISRFDINTADTIMLKQINGIGSVLSNRIIKYRDRLGGFKNPNQLNEVYGLPSETIDKLRQYVFINDSSISKININQASYDNLQNHPYINRKIADAIIVYRNQHGPYESVNDLLKIHIITPEIFEKMKSYIHVD